MTWRTHGGTPSTEALVGRRVHHRFDASQLGTVQTVIHDSGMMRVWWDGHRPPGHGPTDFTAPENVTLVRNSDD